MDETQRQQAATAARKLRAELSRVWCDEPDKGSGVARACMAAAELLAHCEFSVVSHWAGQPATSASAASAATCVLRAADRMQGSDILGPGGTATQHDTYGTELVLDLHGCDVAMFTREAIERYLVGLCKLIDMERCDLHFWDDQQTPAAERQTDPKTVGTSAVQFILTSNVTVHTLDKLEAVFVNVFSCKDFDTKAAASFTAEYFASTDWTWRVLARR